MTGRNPLFQYHPGYVPPVPFRSSTSPHTRSSACPVCWNGMTTDRLFMTRSLFFAFFLRLTFAMALVVAVRAWLIPNGWVLATLLVLGWASLNAYLLSQSVRSSIRPLQISAASLGDAPATGEQPAAKLAAQLRERIADQRFSDFEPLARALIKASREVERALAQAAESRRELEAMIDSMQDAVVAVDAAGRIQWNNQRMQRLIPGSSVLSPVRVGHSLVQTIRDPDVLACVRAAVDQRIHSDRRTTGLLPGRIFEVNASPIPSGGAVAVLHDITRVEQVERTQRDFVANVSHELRTPLTSITGYVETLLDNETLSPVAREFLATILKNARRMNRLTEDLLTMARVEAREGNVRPSAISATALIEDAVAAISGLIQDSNASIEIGHTTSAKIFADADAALQVLGNLMENAIKYGRDQSSGETRVIVSAREISDPFPAVEFSVRDFGSGIGSEHLPRIFERFYRVDKARSVETGGTGLGLAIAQHIIQTQGGTIHAESELNDGSTFRFTLPLAP